MANPSTERITRLEEQVAQLADTCDDLRRRLAALEQHAGEVAVDLSPESLAEDGLAATAPPEPVVKERRRRDGLGALVGRSFVVLGGAFYLRSLTDGGTLSRELGVGLGLAYAALWFVMADRHSMRQRLRSAALHAATASIIAFPVIWEAATAFDVLSASLATELLMLFTALGLGVAWRGGQRSIAWTTVAFSVLVALVFFVELRAVGPVTAHLLLTSAGTLWVAHHHGWGAVAWPPAIVADLLIAATSLAFLTEAPAWLSTSEVLAANLGLIGAFLAVFAMRHLVLEREATLFDGVQLIAAYLIGFEGAARVAEASGAEMAFGLGGLAVAVGAYGLTVTRVIRRQGRGSTYFLYTSLGALALVDGLRFLPWEEAGSVLLGVAALLAVGIGRRPERAIFRVHAAFFIVAAGALSGLWSGVLDAFFGRPDSTWQMPDPVLVGVLLTAAASYALARLWRPKEAPVWSTTAPELVLLTAAISGVGMLLIDLLGGPLATIGRAAADGGALAVLRTAVLAVAVVVLSVVARWRREWELRRLVGPLLAIGLLKLVIEDLPRGRPGTLFLSLVLLGLALIAATRTARRSRPDVEAELAGVDHPSEPEGAATDGPDLVPPSSQSPSARAKPAT